MLSMMNERDASVSAAAVLPVVKGRGGDVADSESDVPYGRNGTDGGRCQSGS